MMITRLSSHREGRFNRAVAQEGGEPNRISMSFYMNDIPPFAGAELERLYGSVYASIGQLRIYDHGGPASTYVARRKQQVIAILLFRIEGNFLRVLNEVISIDMAEINRFARFAFTSFPVVQVIRFHALRTSMEKPAFLTQRHNCLEDIVLALPDSEASYFASLGKNTRRNIKRYSRKLLEAHPDFRFEVLDAGQIDETVIRDIVALNRARMAEKSKVSSFNDGNTDTLTRLAQDCGLVCVGRIRGRICAGAVAFRAGQNIFLNVIAHDPQYDQYWLGILCSYMTICASIARKGREFHFLWGEYEYKYTLLGVRHDLDNLTLYRSPADMVRHAGNVFRMAWQGMARRMQQRLHALSHPERPLPPLLKRLVHLLRNSRVLWPAKWS